MHPKLEIGRLIGDFTTALAALPETHAEVRQVEAHVDGGRVDAIVEATVAGRSLVLLVEAKSTAFPRDVRETLWELQGYLAHYPAGRKEQVLGFIIAQALSSGAREELKKQGFGYYDRGGSLYLPAEGAFVYVDRPPPRAKTPRALTSVFHGRRGLVLRALFQKRDQWVGVKDIADVAKVSPATVSQTLSELERREWVQTRGSGPAKQRRLTRAREMLDAWVEALAAEPAPRARHYFVPSLGREGLVSRIAEHAKRDNALYAVTGEAAAQAYAAHLTSISRVRCRMRPDQHADAVMAALGARLVEEGWNLALIEAPEPADYFDAEFVDGVMFASPLQTYLDLQHASGRGKEMAEHLREERLGV